MAALVGYGIVAMAALGYGGPWLWRAVTVWSNLPEDTQSSTLLSLFRRCLKLDLFRLGVLCAS